MRSDGFSRSLHCSRWLSLVPAIVLFAALPATAQLAVDAGPDVVLECEDADGAVESRHWDFGDGTTSADQNPSHTYGSAGMYDVVLTVTDSAGQSHSDTLLMAFLSQSPD